MANTDLRAEPVLVTLPNRVPVMPAVTRILSRYDRANLEAFISVAIDLLDVMDGDTEMEDSEAGNPDVDERGRLLPGVYVPTSQDEDREHSGDECDYTAWPEWHTLPPQQRRSGSFEGKLLPSTPWHGIHCEDDEDADAHEDDDPAGQCTEDEISTIFPHGDGPGCPISDVDERSVQPPALN